MIDRGSRKAARTCSTRDYVELVDGEEEATIRNEAARIVLCVFSHP